MASAIVPYLPAILSALGSVSSGVLGGGETDIQKTQRNVIDDLLQSLSGDGPYSDLFNVSEDVFQKSFIEPAKARFQNQIAPQIQQSFIQGGQQRSTGLDNQLLQAGVNLDQMLNQQYGKFQQQGQQRQFEALSKILGQGKGSKDTDFMSKLTGSIGGYLGSDTFQENVTDITDVFKKRKGFES